MAIEGKGCHISLMNQDVTLKWADPVADALSTIIS